MEYRDKQLICKRKYDLAAFLLLIAAYILFIRSIFSATKYAMEDASIRPHYIYLCLALLAYAAAHEIYLRLNNHALIRQWIVINMTMAILFILLMFKGRNDLAEVNRQTYLWSYAAIIFICSVLSLRGLWGEGKAVCADIRGNCESWLYEYKGLIILLLITVTILILQSGSEPRWDGAYLYLWLGGGEILHRYLIWRHCLFADI